MPVHALLNIAVRAARNAGEIIVRSMNRLESLQITSKGRNDFVTEVDQAAEREIIAHIRKLYPRHSFLGEESAQKIVAAGWNLEEAKNPSELMKLVKMP